jgi:Ca2+-binding EF-hand superfamily protein
LAKGAHDGAVPQGTGHRHSDGVSADAEGTTAVKFDEAADDDELLLRVFKDMDTNGDGVVSREELDKALESWTSSRELVEALQGAVQIAGTGIKFDTFKKMVNQVRAREHSKLGEAWARLRAAAA